jgi:hypothetical protein
LNMQVNIKLAVTVYFITALPCFPALPPFIFLLK